LYYKNFGQIVQYRYEIHPLRYLVNFKLTPPNLFFVSCRKLKNWQKFQLAQSEREKCLAIQGIPFFAFLSEDKAGIPIRESRATNPII
jgi:hypothetical protein